MSRVVSKDGTIIGYEKIGSGPAVILVDGALSYREYWGGRPLAAVLSKDCTVYAYDRRGRGESTDTLPYAVEREIEDIEALIDEAGGPAYLVGISSGAVLALKAAAILGPARVAKLALYEPPFFSEDEARHHLATSTRQVIGLLEAGRGGDAVASFLSDVVQDEKAEDMRQSPEWPIMEALAPTLAYDIAVVGDGSLPIDAAQTATMPALVLDGSASWDFMHEAADNLARAMPHATRRTLQGQTHDVSPEVLAPVLAAFFNA
jgi:pimeloyl-ACP methyl ester carboxylesterase